jgi:hypothetical protein
VSRSRNEPRSSVLTEYSENPLGGLQDAGVRPVRQPHTLALSTEPLLTLTAPRSSPDGMHS